MPTTEEFTWTEVHNGPNREELFDALRLRDEGRMVTFSIRREFTANPAVGTTMAVETILHGIEASLGSPKCQWIVKIFYRGKPMMFYYDVKSRKGHVIQPSGTARTLT